MWSEKIEEMEKLNRKIYQEKQEADKTEEERMRDWEREQERLERIKLVEVSMIEKWLVDREQKWEVFFESNHKSFRKPK